MTIYDDQVVLLILKYIVNLNFKVLINFWDEIFKICLKFVKQNNNNSYIIFDSDQ